jgi:hypothetical protein
VAYASRKLDFRALFPLQSRTPQHAVKQVVGPLLSWAYISEAFPPSVLSLVLQTTPLSHFTDNPEELLAVSESFSTEGLVWQTEACLLAPLMFRAFSMFPNHSATAAALVYPFHRTAISYY